MIPNVTAMVLGNGLTVIKYEIPSSALASVWMWYRVGARDEGPGRSGVSHWVEHVTFRATRQLPADRLRGILEKVGGTMNGYTWLDQTAYSQVAPACGLDQMLFIEAERMTSCLFEPADCEAEKSVILAECQRWRNNPEIALEEQVVAAAFTSHGYRHPPIGNVDDITRMTPRDACRHYRRHYAPNNAVLVLAGGVTAGHALDRVHAHFDAIPAAALSERARAPEPVQQQERRVEPRLESSVDYLKLAYRAPAAADDDFPAFLLLDAVMAGVKGVGLLGSFTPSPPQRSTRLARALVNTGVAARVSSEVFPTEHPYLYMLSAIAGERGGLDELEFRATEAIDEVRRCGVTATELARARRQVLARITFSDSRLTTLAHELGYFASISALHVRCDIANRIAAVTLADVNAAAARYLRSEQRVVGRVRCATITS